jgi:co-chaperonin GroES (HSP10)
VKTRESYISKGGVYEPLIGVVKYSNDELRELGVKDGDEVSFEPDSEYEFTIDGEKLYRMFTKNITVKWN